MRCPKCNTALPMSANFCIKCGEPLKPTTRHRTRKLVCDSCGGEMTVEEDRPILKCPYCGAKELIPESDKVTVQRIKSKTYKEVEKGKQEVELERQKLKLTKIYFAEQRKKKESRNAWIMIIVYFAILAILLSYLFISEQYNKMSGKIKFPVSEEEMIGNQYDIVVKQLEEAGFTNIETTDLDDSGIFRNNDGKVKEIHVNGDTDFSGTYFEKDVKIHIYYH